MVEKKLKSAKEEKESAITQDECLPPFNSPQIALFDVSKDVNDALANARFLCESATLGSRFFLPNQKNKGRILMRPDCDWPRNLHEFDICIFDLTKHEDVEYSDDAYNITKSSELVNYWCECQFPQTVFDSRPIASAWLTQEIDDFCKKKSIVIIFCSREITFPYQHAQVSASGISVVDSATHSIFDLLKSFPSRYAKTGKKFTLPVTTGILAPLFSKHLENMMYETVFEHPNVYSQNNYIPDPNFIPLLFNDKNEIVSFCIEGKNSISLVFPDVTDKAGFVTDLCNIYLPEVMPELFPSHGQFGWLDDDYLLPGEAILIDEKAALNKKYAEDLLLIEKSISETRSRHKFLHSIISETGSELVESVKVFLEWLEFSDVKNMDENNPEIREEDIQIESDKGLLVIEIKGIGGTSTDKDCSQISKIRYRRSEERGKFDVFGLYIVNHQRYISPRKRNNPPFTDNQLKDAKREKRGLLTTYSLFNAYFYIENGLLTKDEVREELFEYGLIDLKPKNLYLLGIPTEIFHKGTISIINLNGEKIVKKGDVIIVEKDDVFYKAEILSLKLNDVDVEQANNGEVGIRLNISIKNNTKLYLK